MLPSQSDQIFMRTRLTWLAYVMLAYYAYLQAALGPLMPFLRHELHLSYTAGGLHLSAFAVGMILAGLLADRVIRLLGRRRVFWGGSAGMLVGLFFLITGQRVELTILGTFLMGIIGTFSLITIQAILSDLHGAQRATALMEANLGASLLAGMSPVLIGGFQNIGSTWRNGLLVMVVVLIGLVIWFRREPIPDSPTIPVSSGVVHAQRLPAIFWLYWLCIFFGVSTEWCLGLWGADFLQNVVGLQRANASMMMSIFFLAVVSGRLISSRLTRVFPSERLLFLTVVITMIGFPIFWLSQYAPLNIVGLFVVGFGTANLYPLTLSAAVGRVPHQANAASARISLGAGLAIFSAPLTLGRIADAVGLSKAYGIVAVLLLLTASLIFFANRFAEMKMSPFLHNGKEIA